MKTKPLTFLLALTFLFLFSGCSFDEDSEVKKEYWDNGELKTETHYKNGKRDGRMTSWNENGGKESERNFKSGKLEGLETVWNKTGGKLYELNYKNGIKEGRATWWDENGNKKHEEFYKNGKLEGPKESKESKEPKEHEYNGSSKEELKSIKKARKIISQFKDQITADISISEELLKSMKEERSDKGDEFLEYYQSDIIGRIKNPVKHIIDSAIRLNDVDIDGDQDIIFWTEGISPSAWGGKEFVYVITMEADKPLGIIGEELDPEPSRTEAKYRKSFFWEDPNKDCGYNRFVAGLLTYMVYGASGSTNVRYYISYNKYEQKIEFDKEISNVFLVPYDCSS